MVVVLVCALVAPTAALGFNWTVSPSSPLVKGGVHSKAKFEQLLLHSSRVASAIKRVLKADGIPSWVWTAAVNQTKAGAVHSSSLKPGTKIGALGFGPTTIRIVKNTIWKGKHRLPFYYVVASKSAIQSGFRFTTSYKVCLAQTCGNPFVFDRTVTKKSVSPPPVPFNLYVEKRQDTPDGNILGGWTISGTVGGDPVSVTTTSTGPTLVGTFPSGTTYDLSEVLQTGWQIVSPAGGESTGTITDHDVTLVYVNSQIPQPPVTYNLYVEKREACYPCDKDWNDCLKDWSGDKGCDGTSKPDCVTSPTCDWVPGKLLGGWTISGTVGGDPVSVTTTSTGPSLVGSYAEGTAYDLSELLQAGWQIVSPAGGEYTGTMPAHDVTLVFVNKKVKTPHKCSHHHRKRCGQRHWGDSGCQPYPPSGSRCGQAGNCS